MFSILFGLASLAFSLVVLSAPFCLLQLAFCKFCPIQAVRLAPPVLFGAGFLWSFWYLTQGHTWGGMMLLLVTFPCTLGLVGSALGWAVWKRRTSPR